MPLEELVIRRLEALLGRLRSLHDHLSTLYPANDLRLSAIALPANVLHSSLLIFAMAEFTITHERWWVEAYGPGRPTAADYAALRNLESMTKHAFLVFFLSRIEWTFRKLITHVSPGACGAGAAPFKNIYDHLLTKFGLTQFIPLYDLCRLSRNAVHSNGIFVSERANDRSVMWKGSTYTFKHMAPIDFMTQDLVLQLYCELTDSLEAVINHPALAAIPLIEDRVR